MKPNNKNGSLHISFEDLVSSIESLEYNTDITSFDTNQTLNKKGRQVGNECIPKSDLDGLLAKFMKFIDANIELRKNFVSEIEQLYSLVKRKLGNDLYLFNIQLVVELLKKHRSAAEYNLSKTLQVVFGIILREVESELKPVFSISDEQKNLFYDCEELTKVVRHVVKTDAEDIKSLMNKMSSLYIYLIIKNLKNSEFSRRLFMVERVMAVHLADLKQEDRNKCLLKHLPDAFSDKNPKSRIRNSINIFFTNYIAELEQDVGSLEIKLHGCRENASSLSDKVTLLAAQIGEKENALNDLAEQIKSNRIEINRMQSELLETKNRLEYERNMYETQLQNLRKGLINRLHNNLRIELQGLSEFSNGLPSNTGDIIRMYITNIQQVINGL